MIRKMCAALALGCTALLLLSGCGGKSATSDPAVVVEDLPAFAYGGELYEESDVLEDAFDEAARQEIVASLERVGTLQGAVKDGEVPTEDLSPNLIEMEGLEVFRSANCPGALILAVELDSTTMRYTLYFPKEK